MNKLDGKVAIVTGGASGIGKGIVSIFLKYGAKVAIFDYSDKLDEVIKEFAKKGYELVGCKVDIRNVENVNKSVEDVVKRFGKIDILANNAGVIRLVSFMEMTDETRDFHFDINIKGAWNVSKACIKYLIESKGAIVNTASVTGNWVADPGEVAYATTKAAITGFTKGLAADMAQYGVRVNCVHPGYVHTPLVDDMAETSGEKDSVINSLANAIPLKRLGKPEEVGELVAFLASDESAYITGSEFAIDGGSTLPETNAMGV